MKKYRVWGYETQGYYIDLDANNKQDAHDKALWMLIEMNG